MKPFRILIMNVLKTQIIPACEFSILHKTKCKISNNNQGHLKAMVGLGTLSLQFLWRTDLTTCYSTIFTYINKIKKYRKRLRIILVQNYWRNYWKLFYNIRLKKSKKLYSWDFFKTVWGSLNTWYQHLCNLKLPINREPWTAGHFAHCQQHDDSKCIRNQLYPLHA